MPPRKSKSRTPLRSASHASNTPRPTNGTSAASRTPLRSPATTTAPKEGKAPPERERTDWARLEELNPDFAGFKIWEGKPGQVPPTPSSKKRKRDEPVYSEAITQKSPFAEELDATYAVAPASYWEDTNRYRKFTVLDKTFEVNDFVFVRPSPEPGRENATITNWVAKVLEVRAGDEQHVYLRVYWMYRPEDLPYPGRRPYHGSNELIATNEMQIIDATTVQDSVQVKHYVEDDGMSEELNGDQLFWRQTYSVLKTPVLSELPKHCIDKTPFNPDVHLVQCDSCTKWLHAPCIEERVLTSIHKKHNLPFAKKARGKRKSSMAANQLIEEPEPSFKAEVILKRDRAIVQITNLRADGEEAGKKKSWEEEIRCLLCKNVIDAGKVADEEGEGGDEEGENGTVAVGAKKKEEGGGTLKAEDIKPKAEETDREIEAPFRSSKSRRMH